MCHPFPTPDLVTARILEALELADVDRELPHIQQLAFGLTNVFLALGLSPDTEALTDIDIPSLVRGTYTRFDDVSGV